MIGAENLKFKSDVREIWNLVYSIRILIKDGTFFLVFWCICLTRFLLDLHVFLEISCNFEYSTMMNL